MKGTPGISVFCVRTPRVQAYASERTKVRLNHTPVRGEPDTGISEIPGLFTFSLRITGNVSVLIF